MIATRPLVLTRNRTGIKDDSKKTLVLDNRVLGSRNKVAKPWRCKTCVICIVYKVDNSDCHGRVMDQFWMTNREKWVEPSRGEGGNHSVGLDKIVALDGYLWWIGDQVSTNFCGNVSMSMAVRIAKRTYYDTPIRSIKG